jgi:hypothetical protein
VQRISTQRPANCSREDLGTHIIEQRRRWPQSRLQLHTISPALNFLLQVQGSFSDMQAFAARVEEWRDGRYTFP